MLYRRPHWTTAASRAGSRKGARSSPRREAMNPPWACPTADKSTTWATPSAAAASSHAPGRPAHTTDPHPFNTRLN
eukprot:CAMPEP_0119115936 /NCGR_PEP_ID=MMETSP1180-20130426/52015_1 /TAXON_ID=3052 ORGANISM="Chlamydomonas cf sp, Strain CCMP681" /NCGR_SAMPLE_ID=MMETSP1180 /ASSEMBLY_ACC=CAM_ASM_000741 /LENGTH=75 /DNA_ID=CAMNT_0007105043 /DNA_START=852 /DNA_END=1079 /DNA_ORIENTATION=-